MGMWELSIPEMQLQLTLSHAFKQGGDELSNKQGIKCDSPDSARDILSSIQFNSLDVN